MADVDSLKTIVEGSTDPRHDISSWVRLQFQRVTGDPTSKGTSVEYILKVYDELITFCKYLTEIDDLSNSESHKISLAISQLLCSILTRLQTDDNGKIYDAAEVMANIFAEENVIDNDENDKSSSKKNNSKKSSIYTFPKELAVTTLSQMFELFSKDIHSLVSFILPFIFKNIKKTLEKSKYFHALYSVSLARLLRSILRNTNGNFFDNTYSAKFTKLSKSIFEEMNDNQIDYPVDFISALVECWTFIYKQESFIQEHKDEVADTLYFKFWKSEIAVYGISNDYTRNITAKALAEIIFDYQFTKKILTLEDALSLYVKIFRHCHSRDVRAGCFESLSQFIILSSLADTSFLHDCKYLYIVQQLSSIVSEKNITNKKPDTIGRWLNMLKSLHKLILPYISESSKNQILLTLLGLRSEDSFAKNEVDMMNLSETQESEISNQWFTLLQQDLIELLLLSLSSSSMSDNKMCSEVKQRLISLATSDIYNVRLYSAPVLKVFLTNFPDLLDSVILNSLKTLLNAFENKGKTNLPFAQLHGHALVIANLIDIADKDYVSYELIMRVTVFATSFIKNHTTSTNGDLYFKGLVCWILLTGLMNYVDDQYLSTQTAQLLLFWKVLLTHSFTYRNEEELFRNLKTRTHALTCLLTFLNNVKLNKELSTQVSYLLTKCSNFNHSVELKSGRIDDALLENENRILQIYLRMEKYIRYDFNSSLLILIMKNFSDPNLYIEPSNSLIQTVKKIKRSTKNDNSRKEKVLEHSVDSILRLEDNFAYGISSKITNDNILCLNSPTSDETVTEIPGLWSNTTKYWYDIFDKDVTCPISRLLSNDSLVLLFGNKSYAKSTLFMPKVTTSLIDFSMELFSSVFPYLNSKIQYSLIENLNLSLFSKATTPMRSVAISANTCTALYASLRIIEANDITLDKTVGNLMVESIRKIEFLNDNYLTCLKSNCIGLITAAVRRGIDAEESSDFIDEQCNILVKSLSDNEEPFSRLLNILSLASIYQSNSKLTRFDNIYEILFTMIKDPHPVIHSWSLRALNILIRRHSSMSPEHVSNLLVGLQEYLLNPTYGYSGNSTLRYNYNIQYNSHYMIASIVDTVIENIGPSLRTVDRTALCRFRNICFYFICIGDLPQQLKGIQIFLNISIFKMEDILHEKTFITVAENIITSSIFLGIGSSYFDTTFTERRELISKSSSINAAFQCFNLFEQLSKLQKGYLFYEHLEITSWRYLALYPECSTISDYFREWLKQVPNTIKWLEKLQQIYDMSNDKLFRTVYSTNKKILLERGAIDIEEKEITDELEEKINDTNVPNILSDKSELSDALKWKTKEIILGLIAKLCSDTQNNPDQSLSHQISALIKLSFNATSMRLESINKLGLSILHLILKMFCKMADNEYPQKSILEQYEAQISSALIPVFHKGSSPDVIAMAINVGAEIVYSEIVPSTEQNRISQLLIKLLDNLNSKTSDISIGNMHISTKTAKRKIELATLNGWAKLTQQAIETNNKELMKFTEGYWPILTPLWIVSLREYMILNYECTSTLSSTVEGGDNAQKESDSTKLMQYEPVWQNMTKALSSLLYINKDILLQNMDEDELDSFMFALVSKCLDEILRNIDNEKLKMGLLRTVHDIFKCNILLKSLLSDDIFSEVVGIFNRLISTGSSKEKLIVIDIINDLIRGYRIANASGDSFLADIDKLYELLKLLMFIISDTLPFIRVSDMQNTIEKDVKLTQSQQDTLRKVTMILEENIIHFDEIFKVDLYACQLFIIGRIYLSKSVNDILPIFLSLLKSITSDLVKNAEHENLLDIFYESTYENYSKLNSTNRITTFLLLVTNGFNNFKDDDFTYNTGQLYNLLDQDEICQVIIQGLKRIAQFSDKYDGCRCTIKLFIKKVFEKNNLPKSTIRPIIGLLITFTKTTGAKDISKFEPCFLLCLLFICKYYEEMRGEDTFVSNIIDELLIINPEIFKKSLEIVLQSEQKQIMEKIIAEAELTKSSNGAVDSIPLKTFK
ncbi:similar to Saccharomyces cerevisiae YJL207C LAA1 AP-1 accessory protein [Maudiozyma barnettii]|uniref:Similar to Saccharomyces cerevisiae YJL207C LAA1 AP-1 accessory protein n=1 Tax=Maudiozyma barnettii TaxID=61262 RepID=A0A8H2VAL0_9SACH|nr:Laa1p [Kazachstania barnettii]CAB4251851.1 similar to Saccharomyces cerevisiae YJL207C LAA1 AP-1 accessory protein [Kazachstania barnettii]CAD1778123.1 similar to Saccharomyces cerevisiae YJL207C LAA1 AP-1 accessory protein [Kazachstania barnettii]